ncbi:MAG TPA: hypothetical protein PLE74_12210, partial [Candidatus Cloacimonadota bacterium]|nr:hypothetical protein [Candidatus Cloacimonadota bacterium]
MKHFIWSIIILSLVFQLQAKYSDAFLNGVYSQYQVRYMGTSNEVGTKFDSLGYLLHEAGFNAVHFETIRDNQSQNDILALPNILTALDSNHIDAVLYDLCWNDASNTTLYPLPKVGVGSLSMADYLKMEAEYQLIYNGTAFLPDMLSAEDPTKEDLMTYVFAHDTGYCDHQSGQYSNGNSWVCDPTSPHNNVAGLALYNPRFRWKSANQSNPRSIAYDLFFYNSVDAQPDKENKLYLRLALKWAENLDPNIPIADISLIVAKSNTGIYDAYNPSVTTNYVTLPLHPTSTSYTTSLNSQDFTYGETGSFGFRIFEYYVDIAEIYNNPSNVHPNLSDVLAGGYFKLISPQIYWCGNATLYIDYIEFEDEFHRDLRINQQDASNSVYFSRLYRRLSQIESCNVSTNNIAYYYTIDEPFRGTFDAFGKLQTYMLSQSNRKIITCIDMKDHDVVKPNPLPSFYQPELFIKEAMPERILIDNYPLQEWGTGSNLIQWNDNVNSGTGVQNKIQSLVLTPYQRIAEFIKNNSTYHNTELFYCPQIFGEKSNGGYWKYVPPPKNMTKCLQLLPLCYGADGILSFTIASNRADNYYGSYTRYAPLIHEEDFSDIHIDPDWSAYQMLKEANDKINVYGPIIRGLTWDNADAIMVDGLHQNVSINDFGLDSLAVISLSNPSHPYEGYVQCGYYHTATNKYFMLVNRRAVFRSDGQSGVLPDNVDASFTVAPNQNVQFTFNSITVAQYGGCLGLFDPYSHEICISENNRHVRVSLDAGDGSLRQIVSVLPANFNCVADSLNRDRYAIGTVNIHHGSNLKIPANRTLHTYPNTKIYVTNHSIFRIYGNLLAEDSTMIYVESGSTLDLSNAVCQWGKGAGIIADSSSIIMDSSNMFDINHPDSWAGISCSNSSISLINNSLIGAADTALDLTNCSLNMVSSTIDVPDNGVGIRIIGHNTGSWIHITGTSTSKSQIYSTGNGVSRTCTGIDYNESRNQLKISDTDFSNLYLAINYLAADAAEDSIINCVFDACYHGLQITGFPGLKLVDNCTFSNDTYGIETSYYQPEIDNCSFMGGTNEFTSNPWVGCGILLDYVTANLPTSKLKGNINGCQFEDLYFGILNHQSSPRICTSSFVRNTNGIAITSTSFLDCSRSARNTLSNIENNIVCDNLRSNGQPTVLSFLKLNWGHNQFYQPENGYDFKFPSSFGIFPHFPLGCVNADGNYWSDFAITTYPYTNFIYANYMDPVTHLLNYDVNDSIRFENATALQDTCLYSDADQMFRDILADRCDSEASYWGLCVDRSYLCSVLGNLDLYDLIDYYQTQMDATPDSLNDLKLLARDYQAKAYIQLEEYQSAA